MRGEFIQFVVSRDDVWIYGREERPAQEPASSSRRRPRGRLTARITPARPPAEKGGRHRLRYGRAR